MHSKHSNSAKRSPLGAIIAAILIVIALAAAFIFLIKPVLGRMTDQPVPDAPAATEEIVEEPEPVDMREYELDYPESENPAVAAAIDSVISSKKDDFCQKYDGSFSSVLRTSYIPGSSDEVFNFILITDMDGVKSRETVCIAQDGTLLSSEEVLGESFAQYLSDYIDLFYYTDKWDFNEDGVMILKRDITQAASSEAASYPLFLLDGKGGAEFVILPEALAEGCEQILHQPVALPEKISFGDAGETVTAPETADAVQTESAEVSDAVQAESAEVTAEDIPQIGQPEIITLGGTNASDSIEALAEELGGFAVFADQKVLSGEFRSYRRLFPAKPMVALTFDDGPSDLYTIQILDILKSYGAVATFYEVGSLVETYPEIVRKELEYGCEVGSHTYYHYVLGEQTYDFLVYEHGLADQAFINAIGYKPKTVRPPQGDVMGFTQVVYKEPLIGWSIDTLDWLYKDVNYNIRTVKNAGNLDGQVILMHSIHPTSLESVEPIVQYITSEGYQMVTISELLKYGYLIDNPEPAYYYQVDFFSKGRPAYPVEDEITAEPETAVDAPAP
ncbi:MAG: polysaccharide deacetylase family protein [Oscillospiraceae bacterium]|nr:polysaccharide deacetylase family protein [Oscillospiraceae bacterium]